MGSTVDELRSLGLPSDGDEPNVGLDDFDESERLGDRIAGTFAEVDVDSVEAVRKLREDE